MRLTKKLLTEIHTVLTTAGIDNYHVIAPQGSGDCVTYLVISATEGNKTFESECEDVVVQIMSTGNTADTVIDQLAAIELLFRRYKSTLVFCTSLVGQSMQQNKREGYYVGTRDYLFKCGEAANATD